MSTTTTEQTAESGTADTIIVDLGKKSKKQIKRLRKGRGKLMRQVDACISELQSAGEVSGDAQPIVIVVSEQPEGILSLPSLPGLLK